MVNMNENQHVKYYSQIQLNLRENGQNDYFFPFWFSVNTYIYDNPLQCISVDTTYLNRTNLYDMNVNIDWEPAS